MSLFIACAPLLVDATLGSLAILDNSDFCRCRDFPIIPVDVVLDFNDSLASALSDRDLLGSLEYNLYNI